MERYGGEGLSHLLSAVIVDNILAEQLYQGKIGPSCCDYREEDFSDATY